MGSDQSCRLARGVLLAAVSLSALGVEAGPLAAQCSDGRRESQGRCAAPAVAPPIDPNRLAILPFGTSGADPALAHLGNGLVDLLSAAFNGEIGPAAIEPGDAVLAFGRTSAGKGMPTRPVAMRVARSLGAGQVMIGSIVGNSARFTVTATIFRVPDGAVRVQRVQVEGTADSLFALTTALATQLLGRAVGVFTTTSDEALRAYLDGMVAYRKAASQCAENCEAEEHFVRATRLDSTFVLPAYRLVLLRGVFGPTKPIDSFRPSYRTMWRNRRALSQEQRLLLEALADSNGMYFRMQALPNMERVAPALPNTAEAWDILGDLEFHVGALIGREEWKERSRQAFLRAVELDAKLCMCAFEHLADMAYLAGDVRTFAKYQLPTPWQHYQGAILRGDARALRTARIEFARGVATSPEFSGGMQKWLLGLPLPGAEVDSLLDMLGTLANNDQQRRTLSIWTSLASHFAGRPAAAEEAARRAYGAETLQYYSTMLDYATDDSLAAERLLPLLDKGRPNYGQSACNVALSRLRRADTTGAAGILAELDPSNVSLAQLLAGPRPTIPMICAQVLRGVLASLQPGGGPQLHRADSLMRYMPRNFGDIWNYDLALAFARRGEYALAAAASRRHGVAVSNRWPPLSRLVMALRQEGQWAALAGDTAAAIKALGEYLRYRADPEPVLVPERDSVKLELAALERAWRRPAPRRPGPR